MSENTHDSNNTLVKVKCEKHHHKRTSGAAGHQERGRGQVGQELGEEAQKQGSLVCSNEEEFWWRLFARAKAWQPERR